MACVAWKRREARRSYDLALLAWAVRVPLLGESVPDPPELPEILKG